MTLITREAIVDYISSCQQTADDSFIECFHSLVEHLHDFTSQKSAQQLRNCLSTIKERNPNSNYCEIVLRFFRNRRGEKSLTDFETLQEKIEILFIQMSVSLLKKDKIAFTKSGSLSLDRILGFFLHPLPYEEISLRGTKRCSNPSCPACKKGDSRNCLLVQARGRAFNVKSKLQAKLEQRRALSN